MKLITPNLGKEIGTYLVKKLKLNMNIKSYGKIYKIKGKIHIASKKGDPPNNLTGNLNKSLRFELLGNDTIKVGGGDRNKINYLKYLEGDRLQRYNVKNIIDKEERFFKTTLNKHIKIYLNGVEKQWKI